MSAAILPPLETAAETLPRKKFTREEVEHLTDYGFFEGQRYELIDGDLIDKMGQKPLHGSSVGRLMTSLLKFFQPPLVRVQMSLEVAAADRQRSIPEPDIAVLESWKSDYDRRYPRGDECLLVAEVSDTTIRFDLTRKAALYANAGVPEYWVLDLTRRQLIVHRGPRNGAYSSLQIFGESDSVSLENRTEIIAVADLLPTAPDTVA